MSKQVGDKLVNGGKRWTTTKNFTCRRALFVNGDRFEFGWAPNGTDLIFNAYMAAGTRILGAPLTLTPDGNQKFVASAYGRNMEFSVRDGNPKKVGVYSADFSDGLHCQPDEGADSDPD
jgi:hypothetical protein